MAGTLAGRTLFITGASRGIGKAIALRAARDGANVVIAAKTAVPHPKLPGTIYTAAEEVEKAGGKCLPCVVDIREEAQVEKAVQDAVERFGGIDIVVNNASAIQLTGTVETSMKRYDLMMNINTRGTFLTSKVCIPHLRNSKNPHILNISPPINLKPRWFSEHCAYTMAKYGMSLCVLGMAEEFKGESIAVNALWPRTAIATAAVEMLGGDAAVRMSRKPEIMADAAYHILTQDSRSLTGKFLIDDEVLREHGVTDMDQYANAPGEKLLPDYFLDEAEDVQGEWIQSKKSSSSSPPAAADSPADSPASLFAQVETMLNSDVVGQIKATYLFVLDGDYPGKWFLDLKNGEGSVAEVESGDVEADAVMKSSSHDLVAMFTGKLSPTMAFMGGKLKISGNMGAAMKLEKIMGKMPKSKL